MAERPLKRLPARLRLSDSNSCPEAANFGVVWRWPAAILLAVCAAPMALALDPHRVPEQYIHDRWSREQNYTGGAVKAFAQTPDGYLWIGAQNGLVRFDGLN